MMNSPHAYEQNKAFTKHIVDAMMKALEEKLNKIDDMSRSIDRISHDVENLNIKKNHLRLVSMNQLKLYMFP